MFVPIQAGFATIETKMQWESVSKGQHSDSDISIVCCHDCFCPRRLSYLSTQHLPFSGCNGATWMDDALRSHHVQSTIISFSVLEMLHERSFALGRDL